MADPPDPTLPGGPIDDYGDGAESWVRPSQRRASHPSPEPPPSAADYPPPTEPVAATEPATEVTPVSSPARPRRRVRHGKQRRAALSAGALAVVLMLVTVLVLTSGSSSSRPLAIRRVALPAITAPPAPPPAQIATTKVPTLQVFDQPAATAKVVTTLTAKTDYGLPRTLLATAAQPGWLHVLLPIRPNGSQGWVRAGDVSVTTTDYQIHIALASHHLTLTKAGAPVVATPVVIGKGQTPTPTGQFYVTDPVDLQAAPNGAYGAFALGLSAFSDVLTSFNGGPGQIAVHGTPYADQVGQDLSNGCVRVPNPLILQIAKAVPLGTPVVIS
jgi:lipoprotein-anchoring transpeptidase ErfK/SrfK